MSSPTSRPPHVLAGATRPAWVRGRLSGWLAALGRASAGAPAQRGWPRRQVVVGLVVALVGSSVVAASVVVAARRAGAVEPPPGGIVDSEPNIGWTQGQFSVSDDGVATYKLPLWVPEGRGRSTPQLSLDYNSRAGNGLFGMGWSLSGLPSITWCPRTYAQDGFSDAGHVDGTDPLCLDGNRLLPLTASGDTRGFRTEKDPFARITAFGMADNIPDSFQVEAKDGLILTFGQSRLSRSTGIRLKPKPDPSNPSQPDFKDPGLIDESPNEVTLGWLVDKIADRNGNQATVQYGLVSGSSNVAAKAPSVISYAPNRRIEFVYEPRIDSATGTLADPIVGFGAGVESRIDERVKAIRMFGGPDGGTAALLREYQLSYHNNPLTGQSQLTEIKECDGGAGTAQACKVSLPLSYNVGSRSFEQLPAITLAGSVALNPYAHWLVPGDIDGNGGDLIYHVFGGNEATYVQRPNGVPVAAPDLAEVSTSGLHPVDVDGDGRTELLADEPVTSSQHAWQLFGSNGSTFAKGPGSDLGVFIENSRDLHEPAAMADLDGNGLPDFVQVMTDPQFGGKFLDYRLNTGATGADRFGDFGSVVPPDFDLKPDVDGAGVQVADTDGDGRAEVLKQRYFAGGVPGGYVAWGKDKVGATETGAVNVLNTTRFVINNPDLAPDNALFGDLNGDGLKDAVELVRSTVPGSGRWQLRAQLNSGNGFGTPALSDSPPPTWTIPFGHGGMTTMFVADFNGDGRDDVAVEPWDADTNDRRVEFYEWRDNQFVRTWIVESIHSIALPMDVDGDGTMDLVTPLSDPQSTQVGIYRHLGGVPDLLTGIGASALGPRVEIDYTTLADRSVHTPCTGAVYPQVCVTKGGSIVKQVRVATHAASDQEQWDTYDHTYRDARSDLQGRGWLGFASHTVTRKLTGATTTTEFDNTTRDPTLKVYYRAHLPKVTTFTQNDGAPDNTVFQRITVNTNVLRSLGSGTYTVELQNTLKVEQEHPPTGQSTLLHKQTTDTTYDAFGNKDLVVTTTTGGRKVTEDPTFSNNTTAWLIGLPTKQVNTGCDVAGVCTTRTTTQAFDTKGNPTVNTVQPDNPALKLTTTTAYDTFGNPTSVTRADNAGVSRTDTIKYDDNGNTDHLYPTSTTDALGHKTLIETDPGLVVQTKVTDPNGVVTTMRYDRFGRLRETNHADGSFQHTTNANFLGFQITTNTDAGGGSTQTAVDQLGREIQRNVKAFDGRTAITQTAYDALGRVAKSSRPYFSGETVQFTTSTYDNRDRPLTQTAPDNATIRHSYTGLETHTVDAKGTESYTVQNADGDVESSFEHDPNSSNWLQTSFEYGPFGETTKVTAPDGTVQSMQYDLLGRRTQLVDPSSGTTKTGYNAFGEVTSQTDGTGATTSYTLDLLGRVTLTQSPDGTARNTWDTTPFGIGKLTEATSSDGVTTTYHYTGQSKLQTARWHVDGTDYVVDYGYDPQIGRQTSLTYPAIPGDSAAGRLKVNYHYNASGYLDQLSDAASGAAYWTVNSRNAAGQLTQETFGNGVASTREYDPKTGLLGHLTTKGPGTTGTLDALVYLYDLNRNVRQRQDTTTGRVETYSPDTLDRLTTWALGPQQTTYTYDKLGSLKTETVNTHPERNVTYTYGQNGAPPHALTSRNSDTYGYDGAGRQTSGPQRTITYNTADLPKVITWGQGQRSEFAYDHTGARVRKRDAHHTLVTVAGLFERHVNVDLPDPNLRGALNTHNIMADGRIVAQVTKVQADPGGPVTGDLKVQYLHADAQGSTVLATTQAGTAGERFFYDPWGQRTDISGTPLGTNTRGAPRQGYTGYQHDDEFGLINANGRIYDPQARRFLTPDPLIADPLSSQSYNRYSYVQDNPATFTDPTGLDPLDGGSDEGDVGSDLVAIGTEMELAAEASVSAASTTSEGARKRPAAEASGCACVAGATSDSDSDSDLTTTLAETSTVAKVEDTGGPACVLEQNTCDLPENASAATPTAMDATEHANWMRAIDTYNSKFKGSMWRMSDAELAKFVTDFQGLVQEGGGDAYLNKYLLWKAQDLQNMRGTAVLVDPGRVYLDGGLAAIGETQADLAANSARADFDAEAGVLTSVAGGQTSGNLASGTAVQISRALGADTKVRVAVGGMAGSVYDMGTALGAGRVNQITTVEQAVKAMDYNQPDPLGGDPMAQLRQLQEQMAQEAIQNGVGVRYSR